MAFWKVTSPSGANATDAGLATPRPIAMWIFLAALAVRWAYAISLYVFLGDDGLKGMDSIVYAAQAQSLAQAIRDGTVHGSQWLGEASYTMPLYQWLLVLPYLFFGNAGPIAYVLLQGAFDSGTCALVYAIARTFEPRVALPAAIVAIFNPTQIVLSGLIYTDTPFTFFVALSFFFAACWVRAPTWRNAVLLGGALGGAALIRVTIAPWGLGALGVLAAFAWWQKKPFSQFSNLAITALVLGVSLGAISVRNHQQYGTFALTPQGGDYLARWVFPLAKEMQDRTPFATTYQNMTDRATQRFGPASPDPFEQSRRYQEIGREALRNEVRLTSLAAAWASGIVINLASPAHLLSPPVSALPRTGFYETPGDSFVSKVFNYAFRSGNATYGLLLILGSLGLAVLRSIQAIGIWSLARRRRHWLGMLFAGSWVVFLLLLNGPIASPKYRLPLEPLFNIMTGAGLLAIVDLRRRFQERRSRPNPI